MAARKYVRDAEGKFASTPGGGGKSGTKSDFVPRADSLAGVAHRLRGPKGRELRKLRKDRWAAHDANRNDPANDENSGDRYFRRERKIENDYFRDSAAVKKRYADEVKKRKEVKARAKAVAKAQASAAARAKASKRAAAAAEKPRTSAGQKVARVATAAAVVGAVAGAAKVNNVRVAANARYDQRQATARARANGR